MSQESAGARRRIVSGEESGGCRESGETASALENGGASGWCSNVASEPPRAELFALVDAAIIALDTGETEVARAQLQALGRRSGPYVTVAGEMAFDRCQGEEGLDDPAAESE